MTAFKTIWRQWHIPGPYNPRIYDTDPGEYHMLDGADDYVRHSMQLRSMSERVLRGKQLEAGWTNDSLAEHLGGQHDGSDFDDDAVWNRLQHNGLEAEAHHYIPGRWLNDLLASHVPSDPTGYWRVSVHYETDRFLAAQLDWELIAQAVVPDPIPVSSVNLMSWDDVVPAWRSSYDHWTHWQQRGQPPKPTGDEEVDSGDYGEFGGYHFVARGSMFVWLKAESAKAVEDDQDLAENGLPTAFDPDDFQGDATVSESV